MDNKIQEAITEARSAKAGRGLVFLMVIFVVSVFGLAACCAV